MSSSFDVARVNETTWAVTEYESYGEHPVIYVRINPKVPFIVLSDTGCNSPGEKRKDAKHTHLLDFLQNCPIAENDNKPLDSDPGSKKYVVICTHCHFDHIGGIEQFVTQGADIVASHMGKRFIENDLPTHSICKYVGMRTPEYTVTRWAKNGEHLRHYTTDAGTLLELGQDLGITIFNTPGHTPDELAWYDRWERHLYVGDSFYELGDPKGENVYKGPIIFPKEGNWIDYVESMRNLLNFVEKGNASPTEARIKVGCGHNTTAGDAESMIKDVIQLFDNIIVGKVPVIDSKEQRGEIHLLWHAKGSSFAVLAPKRLCDEAREQARRDHASKHDVDPSSFLRIGLIHQ